MKLMQLLKNQLVHDAIQSYKNNPNKTSYQKHLVIQTIIEILGKTEQEAGEYLNKRLKG